jgi:hypothetical protein
MRLLQSVRSRLKQTKKPQYKFVTHLLGLLLMLPGHATLGFPYGDFSLFPCGVLTPVL